MLQVASVPLPDGEVLLTYLDVSDTARVERALRERNDALETAGRLKSEFIASVSHELRTPLNTVIGFAEILNNQYFGSLNSSQSEYCRGILDSSHQLMTLINDILDLATIEAGYMVLERSRVDIPEMLRAVVTLTQERARCRGLEISLRCRRGSARSRPMSGDLSRRCSTDFECSQIHSARGCDRHRRPVFSGRTAAGGRRYRHWHRSGRSSQSLRKIRLQAGRRLWARAVPGQKPDRVARRKCRNRIGVGPRNPGDLQTSHRPWGRSVLGCRHSGTRALTPARRHGERGLSVASAPRCNYQSRSCTSSQFTIDGACSGASATIRFPAVISAEKQILRIIIATYTTRR
jgi:His Kinase A (phospho-acceptor) domain